MALASTYRPPLTTHQLLISVQNTDEALVAFQHGIPWVDLKNPSAGSLGRPAENVSAQFLSLSSKFPTSRISVALGELAQVDWDWAERWLPHFTVGKVGLAGHREIDQSVVSQLARCQRRIVPAAYADWQRAGSPPADNVLELAIAIESPYLLIDTFGKDGRGLFDWMSVDQLHALQATARLHGIQLVLAGSLRVSDWPRLEQLRDVIIGVRGAVCNTISDRTSAISEAAIQTWLEWSAART